MPSILAVRRRDPWWGEEGRAARRRRRYERLVSTTAFVASVLAVGGAAFAWSIQLGLAATLGYNLRLALG